MPASPAGLPEPSLYDTLGTRNLHFSSAAIQSCMDLQAPDALTLEYTRTMMAFLLFLPRPRQILMIGLGGGSLAKFCHRHLPRTPFTTVEINPQVIALRDAFALPADGPRFAVHCGDGAQYVANSPQRVDVLLLDGFDADGTPAGLCSQAFFDDCHDLLLPGGLLVANLHPEHPLHAVYLNRLASTFGEHVLVVQEPDLANSVVFARRGQALVLKTDTASRRQLAGAAFAPLQPALGRVRSAATTARDRPAVAAADWR